MREDLPADLGVLRVEVVRAQPEGFLDLADERLAHLGHRRGALAPRFHRGLPQRARADPGLLEQVEELEVRADVERQPMVGDPAIHGDPDRRDPRTSRRRARARPAASCR